MDLLSFPVIFVAPKLRLGSGIFANPNLIQIS